MLYFQKSASPNTAIQRTTAYLEGQLSSISTDPYSLSIVTYALTLVGSSKANEALESLMKLAINKGIFHEANWLRPYLQIYIINERLHW